MNVNINKLNAKRVEKGLSIEEFSKALHMNPATYYRKSKNNGKGFKIGDMHNMVDVLNLSCDDATTIFLATDSQ